MTRYGMSSPWETLPLHSADSLSLSSWWQFLPLLGVLLVPVSSVAEQQAPIEFGFELQVYPTGVIPGLRIERGFAQYHSINFRLGVQEIRHQDFGVHDDERGDGAGFSIGYSRYFKPGFTGLSLGARTDLWFNTLDWRDNIGEAQEISGTTDVTVLQPTIDIAYHYLSSPGWFLRPSLAAGFEINIDTDGSDVGQGFIYLASVTVGRRF